MRTARHVNEQTQISWLPVAGVQPVVFVAKADSRPIAILQLHPGNGFQLTTCAGELIGDYDSQQDGEAALEDWVDAQRKGARLLQEA